MAPNLLDMLPAEMLTRVAEQADKHDLAAMRASYRAMAAATSKSFAQEFFVHRKHMWTAYSLKTLAEISNHQTFAKHIKSIEFRFVSLDTNHHKEHTGQVFWESSMKILDGGRRPVKVEQFDVVKNFRRQEELLDDLDNGKRPLMRAFANLNKLGHAGRSLTSFFGFRALAAALGPRIDFEDFRESGCTQLTQRLVDTVLSSGLSISELTVGSVEHRGMTDGSHFDVSPQTLEAVRHAVRDLSSLTLYLAEGVDLPGDRDEGKKFFAQIPRLQTLSLIFDSLFERTCYMVPTCFAGSKNLRTLKLTGAIEPAEQWIGMFECLKQSLRNVRLVRAMIMEPAGDAGWPQILRWMIEHLDLDTLELIGLLVDREGDYEHYCRDTGKLIAKLQGKDEIRTEVEKICASARYILIDDNDGLEMGLYTSEKSGIDDSKNYMFELDSEADGEDEPDMLDEDA
ncbi:hypothetical protein LTR78_000223 [Recurvomyces mirabilis]|uniref:F-box domain-containing protein n=1 Tax=Recurvomyces mirabilis TaxID=574656 RepID=A0AAE1C6C4_9PEZI|nr:hypothetical protein LTR78_000223 [Recurvomyces mirabilis]KAK5161879.1 hypothetical protein LTS14_000224 [Recurvomyces mirabilis]